MSAFFLSINRSGADFEPSVASGMMPAIGEYGVDDQCLVVQDNFALGYQSFWTVPEEQGERQPLFDEESRTWLMFYGRIDNRQALCSRLNLALSAKLSDAALLHRYLISLQGQELEQVIGPFAFVWFDPESVTILAARDGMGGRNVVYRITDEHIHIASHEMALVAHPSVAYQFNESRVGRMIAQIMLDTTTSVINDLTVLDPGDRLDVSGAEHRVSSFYRCDAAKRIRLPNDKAYAAEFKRLLGQAVARRARSIGPTGAMLSGGMDSVPMSILLSKELAKQSERLTAFSWVYDRSPEADERAYSAPVCQQFDIEQVCINCDDVWPQLDETTYTDPLLPFAIPYIEYQQVLMQSVQQRGIRTLMTGIHGDLLYGHTSSILVELISIGQWRKAWSEFRRLWSRPVNRVYLIKHYIIGQLPGVKRLLNVRRNRQSITAECLQDSINDQIYNQTPDLFYQSLSARRPDNYRTVFSGFAGEDQALGRLLEAQHALERRYPFRDRDLCEFMTAIPSDQLAFNDVTRPIVKHAFVEEFSSELLRRRDKTDFSGAIANGIQNDQSWRVWYTQSTTKWQHYVKKCYFDAGLTENIEKQVVQWRCGYYEYWKSVCYNRVANQLGSNDDNEK